MMASQNTFGVLIVALLAFGLPSDALAQDDNDGEGLSELVREAPDPFNGSFKELSVRGGALFAGAADVTGWLGEVGVHHSFPMYIAAHGIAYRHGRWSVEDAEVQLHEVQAALEVHPFYLALLSEGLESHFLASLHLELAVGPRWMGLSNGGSDSQWGLTGSLGVGFDLPLTTPNRGNSLWLNFAGRRSWSTIRLDGVGDVGLHDYSLLVGLAWRNNGMLW